MFKVIERITTICGETHLAGVPCALLRFAGCPLRCRFCDTTYAYEGGEAFSLPELLDWVEETKLDLVLLTGGEPLLQEELPGLAQALTRRGHQVLVETSGALDIHALPPPVIRSLDIKCPGSGEEERNLWSNLEDLRPGDVVKMILVDRADYEYAKDVVRRFHLGPPVQVMFSAAAPMLSDAQLAEWLLEDKQGQIRINIQAHRLLWPALEKNPRR